MRISIEQGGTSTLGQLHVSVDITGIVKPEIYDGYMWIDGKV